MATEFTVPEFLANYTEDDVYEAMRATLPVDIDSSEGSHTWNLLRPTAIIAAELCESVLPQVIQLIFPEWSYGEYLDAHAQTRGMSRKEATAATGELTITGEKGTVIPLGSMFSTASLNKDDPSVTYMTTEAATIPASGSVTVDIVCTETGTVGDTAVNTIILLSSAITGITGVTNAAAVTGGTDDETDEDLIARIQEYDQTTQDSYVGNAADYRRWAMSVPGIGNALVISATDNTGLITIVLTDTNGDPASETLCTAVYNYIMSPSDPYARLAPINAYIKCVAPTTVAIKIKATVELEATAEINDVSAAFNAAVSAYMEEAMLDDEIKYTRISAMLSNIAGVDDFTGLQIGVVGQSYGTSNIILTDTQLPTIAAANIALTATE